MSEVAHYWCVTNLRYLRVTLVYATGK